jgi:hypothetical protein
MAAAVNLMRDLGGGWNASQLPTGKSLRASFPSGSQLQPPAK